MEKRMNFETYQKMMEMIDKKINNSEYVTGVVIERGYYWFVISNESETRERTERVSNFINASDKF